MQSVCKLRSAEARPLSRWLFVHAVIALAAINGPAHAQNGANNGFINWIQGLSPSQYTVTQGTAVPFNCSYPQSILPAPENYITYLGSCFGNNSATPYFLTAVPPPPSGTYGLPGYLAQNFNVGTGSSPAYEFFELGTQEAVVTILTLPPPAAYYSFQTYKFERQNQTGYAGSPPTPTPPATNCAPGTIWKVTSGSRTFLHNESWDCKYQEFAWFANAINNISVLAATNSALEFNADPLHPTEAIAIVTTGNSQVYQDLLTSFKAAGLNPAQLFLESMPTGGASGLLLGTNDTDGNHNNIDDVFASIFRLTLPQNYHDGQLWQKNPASNILVYRIFDNMAPKTSLYTTPTPPLVNQTVNTIEIPSSPSPPTCPDTPRSYYCDIQELGTLLGEYLDSSGYGQPYTYALSPTVGKYPCGTGTLGPTCIQYGIICAGGTQDTAGYFGTNIGQLAETSPVFVIGVDHATSTTDSSAPVNNADYIGSSISVNENDLSILANNIGISDLLDLNAPQTFPLTSVTIGSPNQHLTSYLYGSGQMVVNLLKADGYNPSAQLQADAQNLYVSGFVRLSPAGLCTGTAFFCSTTTTYPFITYVASTSPAPNGDYYIANGDSLVLTERSYLLPYTSSPVPNATGAAATQIQPPFLLSAQ